MRIHHLVKKLIDFVSNKYLPIVTESKQFQDLETMSFEKVIERMKAYEERTTQLRGNNNNSDGQLLLTHAKWKAKHKVNSLTTLR